METARNITIELKLTRERVFLCLVFLFLTWRPGFLGSETLTLTTYYPAPYGGYVSLLTTGNTYLARDSGRVVIGGAGLAAVDTLTVYGNGTAITTVDNVNSVKTRLFSAATGGYVGTSTNHPLILRTSDADRIVISNIGAVSIGVPPQSVDTAGDVRIGGFIRGLCERRAFYVNKASYCGGSSAVSGNYTIVSVSDSSDNDYHLNQWWYTTNPTSGHMVCCKFTN